MRMMARSFWEDAHDIGAAHDIAVESRQRIGGVQLGATDGREGHVGQDGDLGLVEEAGEPGSREIRDVDFDGRAIHRLSFTPRRTTDRA